MKLTIRTLKRLIKEAVEEATQPNDKNVVTIAAEFEGLTVYFPGGESYNISEEMSEKFGDEYGEYDYDDPKILAAEMARIVELIHASGAKFVYDTEDPDGGTVPWNSNDNELTVSPVSVWLQANAK